MGTERMLIVLEDFTDNPIVARDIDGAEHELTVAVRAGMVCIQDREHQEVAYIMHPAAALELGLQLIRACVASRDIEPPTAGSAGRSAARRHSIILPRRRIRSGPPGNRRT
jgi:hypothetical protein